MAATGNNQKTLFIYNAWGTEVWLKLYDSVDPTYGTTAPSHIFRVEANSREVFSWPTGLSFATGLSYTVVTVNGTLCPAFPSTANVLRIITS